MITAYQAGRDVDLPATPKHELMPVPVSLAEMNGTLRTGNKSVLAEILTTGMNCPEAIDISDQSSTLIIDEQALVVTVGKPSGAVTFGDLADIFVRSVLQIRLPYDRIEVVFDRYRHESIKCNTRALWSKSVRPRRIVEGRDIPPTNELGKFHGPS